MIDLGETTYYRRYSADDSSATGVNLYFRWFFGTGKDFLEPPQVYYVSWCDTKAANIAMQVSGHILVLIAVIPWILSECFVKDLF